MWVVRQQQPSLQEPGGLLCPWRGKPCGGRGLPRSGAPVLISTWVPSGPEPSRRAGCWWPDWRAVLHGTLPSERLGSRRVELGSSEPGKYWPGYSLCSPFSFPGRLCLGKQSSNVPQITKLFFLHLKCQRHFLTPPCWKVRTLHTSVLSQRGNR